jgi:predicted nucleotidyltransferase
MAEPAEVLTHLAAELAEVLGDDLLSLALHGSWAVGDFTPGRSDLDVLAALATDPTAATLARLHDVHTRLETDFPEWNGHVETCLARVGARDAGDRRAGLRRAHTLPRSRNTGDRTAGV